MPGIETNRFIGLTERDNHLICSICLNIFNDALRSECEHTFCKSCVKQWIESNHSDCPECRTEFAKRETTNTSITDNNLVVINSCLFKRCLLINNMINEMQIKCDFHFNGCQQPLKLSQLSTHISECEHRFCKKCGLIYGTIEEHNCIELLKNIGNEWKVKYENQLKINIKVNEENCELKIKLKRYKQRIKELKQNYNKSLEDLDELEEKISELKDNFEDSDEDSNELVRDNIEEIENIIEETLQKARLFL